MPFCVKCGTAMADTAQTAVAVDSLRPSALSESKLNSATKVSGQQWRFAVSLEQSACITSI